MANVAELLSQTAARFPEQMAVAVPVGASRDGQRDYNSLNFRELDEDSRRIASGLLDYGMRPGMRIVLMVRPGLDFISLVFALFRAGIVSVLIDPGMGRKNLLRCLQDVEPSGFIGIPLAQAVRTIMRRRFPDARWNVTVGKRWFWRGPTLAQIRARGRLDADIQGVEEKEPAAVIFTTGSTGPPKGVLYRHHNFVRQAIEIRDQYDIKPGEIDLPGFPLFALFNAAMAVSTVIPDMDPTRPAQVQPRNIIEPIQQWKITQAFGSPALWNRVGKHCEENKIQLPTLRRVLSAGAPVPPHVIRRLRAVIHPEGDIHTPYGATEALPVASTSGREVLNETEAISKTGGGTCVGKRFAGMEWKVVEIDDGPISDLSEAVELAAGKIGELLVRGPVVTTEYCTRREANALHKVKDGDGFWHRMGDVGYLDSDDRFWFCGRKAHRVRTEERTMFTIPCEAVFNQHPAVYRSALVGIGPVPAQTPVLIVECWPEKQPRSEAEKEQLISELARIAASHDHTHSIGRFHLHPGLPVDIRHNSKIFREELAIWAEKRSV